MSRVAKAMVTQMGFSAKMGQVAWGGGGGPSFVGQSMGQAPDCSGQTSDEIDEEVKSIVNKAYRCAHAAVRNHAVVLVGSSACK